MLPASHHFTPPPHHPVSPFLLLRLQPDLQPNKLTLRQSNRERLMSKRRERWMEGGCMVWWI
jgi:hypothetical protein